MALLITAVVAFLLGLAAGLALARRSPRPPQPPGPRSVVVTLTPGPVTEQ